MRRKLTLFAAALFVAVCPGCYVTWDIAPGALRGLNGFHEGQTREISSTDDEEISFTSDTEIDFHGNDGLAAAAKFRLIKVRGSTFVGVEREHGAYISVDLSRMASVQMTNFSTSRTVGLSVGLGTGIPALVLVTLALVFAANYEG